MLDRIDSIEKILHLTIPTFTAILEEHKIATLGPSFNSIEYFGKLQEGAIFISLLTTTIEVRIKTPSWDLQDPCCPIHSIQRIYICKEHRKLNHYLSILRRDLNLRYELLDVARTRGWYRS